MPHGLEGEEGTLQNYKGAKSQEKQVTDTAPGGFALGHPERKVILAPPKGKGCAPSTHHQLLQSEVLGASPRVARPSIALQTQH